MSEVFGKPPFTSELDECAQKPRESERARAARVSSERAVSGGAWLKWASKDETPTHSTACPECGGRGRWQVGSVDDTPIYKRCWRCRGAGEIGAVVVKGARTTNGPEFINVTFTVSRTDHTKLEHERKENDMSRINASAVAAVEDDLEPTDLELRIAAQVGVTRKELIEQKAMARLNPGELLLLRTGISAVEILASR